MSTKARILSEQLLNIVQQIQDEFDNMVKSRSDYDKEEQDLLHEIEAMDKFDLYKGWQYCKALSDLRKERRQNKIELQVAKVLVDNIQPKTYVQKLQGINMSVCKEESKLKYLTENKIYKPRVEKGDV